MLDGRLQTEPVIRLRKVRSVAEVLNDTFRFLRQNYAPVGKSLLFIAGPATVIASVAGSLVQVLSLGAPLLTGFSSANFGLNVIVAIVAGLLSSTLTMTVSTGSVLLYLEHGPGGFAVRDVWHFTKTAFWKVLLTLLLAGFLLLITLFIAVIPCLGALITFVLWAYLIVVFSVLIPMVLVENEGPLEAMQRCRRLVRGYWWPTLGVLFIAYVLYMVLGLWVSAPYYVAMLLTTLHGLEDGAPGSLYNIALVAGSIVAGLGSTVLYSIFYTALTLQYFSLVERKGRVGLRARVAALRPSAPLAPPSFASEADDA